MQPKTAAYCKFNQKRWYCKKADQIGGIVVRISLEIEILREKFPNFAPALYCQAIMIWWS